MPTQLSDPPIRNSIVYEVSGLLGKEFRMTKIFESYLRSRDTRIQESPQTIDTISLDAQSAALGATAIVTAADVTTYELSSYLRQTAVDAVSASLQVTWSWTDASQAMTKVGTALTANLITTYEALPTFLVRVDAGTNITIAVAYAAGGGQLRYALEALAKAVG